MTRSTVAAKQEVRERLKTALHSLSPRQRARESEGVRTLLQAQNFWQNAQSVLFYLPTVHEPDILPLMKQALAEGRSVSLPRFDAEEGQYHPATLLDWENDLVKGRYDILEPGTHCMRTETSSLDLVLVPGLGFSVNGARLGRGLGYYDRLLARTRGRRCGLAFACQIVRDLPVESHDVLMDYVVTPTQCLTPPA